MTILFYHNPRCSKSRAVLALLEERQCEFKTIEYLKTPPDESELNQVLDALDTPPHTLLRSGDSDFKALKLDPESLSREQVIDLLLQHPKWFQRPLVMINDTARIGRPIENVESILP